MKFARILRAVYHEPWLLDARTHATVRKLVESRLAGEPMDLGELLPQPEQMSITDGVAYIPVDGVILRKASTLERMCGAIGVEEIAANIAAAEASPEVRGIFLCIDSPGGSVGGVPELGSMVASTNKPTMAHTSGQMCSAAYWLAAAADEISASPSAEIGSIGVYMPWVDESAAYSAMGLSVDVIRNTGADLKGAGYPGTSLTESQRADLQHGVDQIAAMFHAHVLASRGNIAPDTMRGQAFLAADAMQRGLIDSILSETEALASFRKSL